MRPLPLLLFSLALAAPVFAAPVAILGGVNGSVEVLRGGKSLPARTGFKLESGDKIRSKGGTATVFALDGAPRALGKNATLAIGKSPAKTASTNVWRGLYSGVANGFARSGGAVPGVVRNPVTLDQLQPSLQIVDEALGRGSEAAIFARAVLLFQNDHFGAAQNELRKLKAPFAQSAELGKAIATQIAKMGADEKTPIMAAPRLEPKLEALIAFDPEKVAPDARRIWGAPDRSFSLQIPLRWGAAQTEIRGVGTLYTFANASVPAISVVVGAPRKWQNGELSRAGIAWSKTQMPTAQINSGSAVKIGDVRWQTDWQLPKFVAPTDRTRTPRVVYFRTQEIARAGRVFLLTTASYSLNSPDFRALSSLAATFSIPSKTSPNDAWRGAGAEKVEALLDEMRAGLSVSKEINDWRSARESRRPDESFENLVARAGAAPLASREKAGAAFDAAFVAGQNGWKAEQNGDAAGAKTWFETQAQWAKTGYETEKAFYENGIAATNARLAQLERDIAPLALASAVSTLVDILLSNQVARYGDLLLLSRAALNRETEKVCAQKRLELRATQRKTAPFVEGQNPLDAQAQFIETLGELGEIAVSQADFARARAVYLRALELRQRLALRASPGVARVDRGFYALAVLESQVGDVGAARNYYLQSLGALEKREPEFQTQIAAVSPELRAILDAEMRSTKHVIFNNLGILEQERGDYRGAARYFERAQELWKTPMADPFSESIRQSLQTKLLVNQAVLKADSGDMPGAKILFEQALQRQIRLGASSETAHTYFNLAGFAREAGDYEGAKKQALLARQIFEQSGKNDKVVAVDSFLATLALEKEDYPEAEKRALATLQMAQSRGDLDYTATAARLLSRARLDAIESHWPLAPEKLAPAQKALEIAQNADRQSGSLLSEIKTLAVRASLEEARGDNDSAIKDLGSAIFKLESVRASADSDEKFSESRDNFAYYERIVKLLLKQNRPDEAFDYLGRARSKRLREALRLSSLQSNDPNLQKLLERAGELDARIARVRSQLEAEKTAPAGARDEKKVENLTGLLAATQAEFFQVSAQLKAKFPGYERAVSASPRELKKAQRALPEGALLLQFAPLGDSLYIFVVSRDDLKIYTPPGAPKEILANVRRFRALMDRAQTQVQNGESPAPIEKNAELQTVSSALYAQLLAPVEEEIEAAKVVAIIPSGELFYLPFHALARKNGDSKNGEDWEYFGARKPVVTLAAADVLSVVQERDDSRWGRGLLALGDPTGANLPAARAEVLAISRVVPGGEALTGARAQKSVLFEGENQNKRFLHLATHGVLNARQPDESYIQLAPEKTENGQIKDDGKLKFGEIYGLKLDKVDLVTLSACQTALGEGQPDGTEISSLAESFSSAGTPSVLATLWSVEDTSTQFFMEALYREIGSGVPKGEALQKARIALLKTPKTAHPFFWAPFTLLGDWR